MMRRKIDAIKKELEEKGLLQVSMEHSSKLEDLEKRIDKLERDVKTFTTIDPETEMFRATQELKKKTKRKPSV